MRSFSLDGCRVDSQKADQSDSRTLFDSVETPMANVFADLKRSGMVRDATHGAGDLLGREKVTCYVGFDPSAKSLHVGNLIPIMGLVRMQRHGHTPIALVGGGTGAIGDPSGRDQERPLLSTSAIEENSATIRSQLERFLDFSTGPNRALMLNNADWLTELGFMDFLRHTGRHFTVNYMLSKESVRARLARDSGISYTEFTYMLLQAYDFLHLFDNFGCTFQMGGSDQWGNILAGVDLIRRVRGRRGAGGASMLEAHGIVYPLVTTSSGEKFGKSVGNAPTLDATVTSPYRLYQFFLNTDDRDVPKYLKLFTLMSQDEVKALSEVLKSDPSTREAQRALARDVTERVHGSDGLIEAERVTSALFGDELKRLSLNELEDVFEGAPRSEIALSELHTQGLGIPALLARHGVCKSIGEARRLIAQGGLYMNGVRVFETTQSVTRDDLIAGKVLVFRRGSKTYHLISVIN